MINKNKYESESKPKFNYQEDHPYAYYDKEFRYIFLNNYLNSNKCEDADESTSCSVNKDSTIWDYSELSVKTRSNLRKFKQCRSKFGYKLKIKSQDQESSEDEFADLFSNYESQKQIEAKYMKSYKRSLSETDQKRNNAYVGEPKTPEKSRVCKKSSLVHVNSFIRPKKPHFESLKHINNDFGMTREELNTVVKNLAVLEKDLEWTTKTLRKSKKRSKKTSKFGKKKTNKSVISSKPGSDDDGQILNLDYSFDSR